MRKCCANCANGSQNCKPNEKDDSRCEMFCRGGNYGGFIPIGEEIKKDVTVSVKMNGQNVK